MKREVSLKGQRVGRGVRPLSNAGPKPNQRPKPTAASSISKSNRSAENSSSEDGNK